MKELERIRLVNFFLYEKLDERLGHISAVFGPNASGKSSLIDAIQIVMFGANARNVSFNAQGDESGHRGGRAPRTIRQYCLGQYGSEPTDRVRAATTTYITLVFRDSASGEPISVGVCLYASGDRPDHEVLGRYVVRGVELSMSDHLDRSQGDERPREWAVFRSDLLRRLGGQGEDVFFQDSDRFMRQLLLALGGHAGQTNVSNFMRAFRFAITMRFNKVVDAIVRDDVLEAKPIDVEHFRKVTETFRDIRQLIADIKAKLADGDAVEVEFAKAAAEVAKVATWRALQADVQLEIATVAHDGAAQASNQAEERLEKMQAEHEQVQADLEFNKEKLARVQRLREQHRAHVELGELKRQIQAASERTVKWERELKTGVALVQRVLASAAQAPTLAPWHKEMTAAAASLEADLAGFERDTLAAAVARAASVARQGRNRLLEERMALEGERREAESQMKSAQQALARAEQGRSELRPEVRRLLVELRDHGLDAVPVCDLVRIASPDWQPVIEGYLGGNLESLLVREQDEGQAFRVYRAMTGARAVYGAKLVRESRYRLGRAVSAGSVAELINGDSPAAVNYLRSLFGDTRCVSKDEEALAGTRTLTQDGMYISDGSIDRIRPLRPEELRVGRATADRRQAWVNEVQRARAELARLDALLAGLKKLDDDLSYLTAPTTLDGAVRALTEAAEARAEADSLNRRLQEAGDAEYRALIEQEERAKGEVDHFSARQLELAGELGSARKGLEVLRAAEASAKLVYEQAHAAAQAARAADGFSHDLAARQWDHLLQKYGAPAARVDYCEAQAKGADTRLRSAVSAGMARLGQFLQIYREHIDEEVFADWVRSRTWLTDLLHRLRDTTLVEKEAEAEAAYRAAQEAFRNDIAYRLSEHLEWLDKRIDSLNSVLKTCPTFSNRERYAFRRVIREEHRELYNFITQVGVAGPNDDLFGAGKLPEQFKELLEARLDTGKAGVRTPLEDYREFFTFDIEILREDDVDGRAKRVGWLSKRLGPGSGGEHRAPLYVIAGAALASAYHLQRGRAEGLSLMLIDEAFNKMDPTNIIATMRYLETLGLQVFMASPGENQGILTAFLNRYFDIVRDPTANAIEIEGHDVTEESRRLFREDLPDFNPGLIDYEIEAMTRDMTANAAAGGARG